MSGVDPYAFYATFILKFNLALYTAHHAITWRARYFGENEGHFRDLRPRFSLNWAN